MNDPIRTLEEVLQEHCARAVEATGGNVSEAARALGIDRNTLRRHLKRARERTAT